MKNRVCNYACGTMVEKRQSAWWLRCLLPLLFLGLAAIFYYKLANRSVTPQRRADETPVVSVEVFELSTSERPVFLKGHGSIDAWRRSRGVSEIAGRVLQVFPELRPGRLIKAGQVVVSIDPEPLQWARDRADADRRGFESRLRQLEIGHESVLERHRMAVDITSSLENELKRLKDQEGSGFVAQRERDQLEREWLRQKEQLVNLGAEKNLYAHRRSELETSMEQAGLRWKEAVRQLANCEVKMPYDALVEKVHVEEGEWISPGSVMFELADVSKLEVSVPLRTSEVEAWLDIEKKSGWYAVTKHKMAQLRWVDGDVTGEGRVLRIEPDSGSHRMLKVVVGIDADEGLRPGMFVSAEIGGKVVHEAFVVPTSALLHNGSLQEVRLENSQYRVTTIPVTWLRRTETYALATESLKQGMLILKRPEPHLADGSVVNLTGR